MPAVCGHKSAPLLYVLTTIRYRIGYSLTFIILEFSTQVLGGKPTIVLIQLVGQSCYKTKEGLRIMFFVYLLSHKIWF